MKTSNGNNIARNINTVILHLDITMKRFNFSTALTPDSVSMKGHDDHHMSLRTLLSHLHASPVCKDGEVQFVSAKALHEVMILLLYPTEELIMQCVRCILAFS